MISTLCVTETKLPFKLTIRYDVDHRDPRHNPKQSWKCSPYQGLLVFHQTNNPHGFFTVRDIVGQWGKKGLKVFLSYCIVGTEQSLGRDGEAEQMSRAAHMRLKDGDLMLHKTYNHEHTYVSCTILSKFCHSQVYSFSLFIDGGQGMQRLKSIR